MGNKCKKKQANYQIYYLILWAGGAALLSLIRWFMFYGKPFTRLFHLKD